MAFHFVDKFQAKAPKTVQAFRAAGLRVILLSSDMEGLVGRVAVQLGIDLWYASTTRFDKSAFLGELRAKG